MRQEICPYKRTSPGWAPSSASTANSARTEEIDGSLIPIVELDEDAAGMIAAIEVDEDGRTTKVRLWDKNQALEKALKYLGLYERENTQHSENLELQVVLVGKP
jgi:hypothetical protein